jgi:intracellular sulfur oxidation DsrE/DsrF family protein
MNPLRRSRLRPHPGLLFAWLLWPLLAVAEPDEIAHLLTAAEPPAGVVFEVVEGREEDLGWALRRIRGYVERLRARYPAIELAVVTHGREQFALQGRYREEFAGVHADALQLVAQDAVPVHVCGTHAGWYGVSAADFPDYVDVAPSGPAQINLYLELGYELVKLQAPAD